jgi:phenylalanyl-tRNA synthetase beta chain
LSALGLFEAITMPMRAEEDSASVPVVNPLSQEEAFLRTRLLPGLARLVEHNWASGVRDVRLFEVGTVFRQGEPGGRPIEEIRVGGVITGARSPRHWSDGGKGPDSDRWDLANLFHRAVALAHPGATVQGEGGAWVAVSGDVGVVGRTERLEADSPPWAAPLYGFEVVLDPVPRAPARYEPVAETPASTRDVALLLPHDVTAMLVEDTMREVRGTRLESVEVVSEYRGDELPAGSRSVAFRLTFRDPERTLRDKEIDEALGRILKAVQQTVGVAPRDIADSATRE